MTRLFSDNRDWYMENILAKIDDREVKAVAEILNMHYGKENRVELEDICLAVWGKYTTNLDRKCRDICEILTTQYHFPVGSSAGCSGRWRARPEEIEQIVGENAGRIASLTRKNEALRAAIFPPEEPAIPAPVEWTKQPSLFGD